MANGQDGQQVITPYGAQWIPDDMAQSIMSLFGRGFENLQDLVEAFNEREVAENPQARLARLREEEAEAEAEASLLQRVTAAREGAVPDEEELFPAIVGEPVAIEELGAAGVIPTPQRSLEERRAAAAVKQVLQAEDIFDARDELVTNGIRPFLLSYGDQLPRDIRRWLLTDAAMDALSKDFDISAFEVDAAGNLIVDARAPSPALAFLVQEMENQGLHTRYAEFRSGDSEEAKAMLRDAQTAPGFIPRPDPARDHNLNAFFQGNLTKHLDELLSNVDKTRPGVASWIRDKGTEELYNRFLQSTEFMWELPMDFAATDLPDVGVDPLAFIENIDQDFLVDVWADMNVEAALDQSVRQQVASLPGAIREKVSSQIYSSLYSQFNDQLFDVGGVPRFSTFLRSVNFSEFDPEIDFEINEYRTGTEGRAAGITPRALISPEFFGQTMGSLFSQATATLLEDLGREPTFPEIQTEVQAIQQQQIEDYTAEGGDLPPFGGPVAAYDAQAAAERGGGPGWPGMTGQPNVRRPWRPFPRPFFVNR